MFTTIVTTNAPTDTSFPWNWWTVF